MSRMMSDSAAVGSSPTLGRRMGRLTIIAAFLAVLLPVSLQAQTVKIEILAITGDVLPEGIITNVNYPSTVSRNLVVVQANFETAAFDDPSALLVDRSGSITTVILEPHKVAGGQEELGQFNFNGISVPLLNSSGQILFPVEVRPVSGCCAEEAWYLFDLAGNLFRAVVRAGDPAPDGNGFLFVNQTHKPAFNEAGEVAFWASISGAVGGLGNGSGLFLEENGSLTRIVRRGQVPPDGTSFFDQFSWPSLNGLGDVAFLAVMDSNEEGVYRGNGGALVEITRTGRTVPPGWEVRDLTPVQGVPVNDSKQVAFWAEVDTGAAGCCGEAIYLADGPTISLLAYTGQHSDRPGLFVPSHIGSNLELNNQGQVAFTADSGVQSGIFRVDAEELLTIALEGDVVPGTQNSPFVDFFGSAPPFALNDNGDLAFVARFDDGQEFQDGLFYYSDATGLLPPLVHEGGPLAGGIIKRLEFVGTSPSAFRSGEPSSLDEDGDVAFFFSLEDDREGIARVEVCEVQNELDLSNTNIAGNEIYEACNGIEVTNVAVQTGGDLTLQAGESIKFHEGFRVESGGRLRVLIDTP